MSSRSKPILIVILYLTACTVAGDLVSSRDWMPTFSVSTCCGPDIPMYNMFESDGHWRFDSNWESEETPLGFAAYFPNRVRISQYGFIFPSRKRETQWLHIEWPSSENQSEMGDTYTGSAADRWRAPLAKEMRSTDEWAYLADEVLAGDLDRTTILWAGIFGNGAAVTSIGIFLYWIISVLYRSLRIERTERHNLMLRSGQCPHCRYDLRGVNSDVCAECGASRALITT